MVCQAAVAAGISELVLISTDKAVRSTNVMGASKRLAELVALIFVDSALHHFVEYIFAPFLIGFSLSRKNVCRQLASANGAGLPGGVRDDWVHMGDLLP